MHKALCLLPKSLDWNGNCENGKEEREATGTVDEDSACRGGVAKDMRGRIRMPPAGAGTQGEKTLA